MIQTREEKLHHATVYRSPIVIIRPRETGSPEGVGLMKIKGKGCKENYGQSVNEMSCFLFVFSLQSSLKKAEDIVQVQTVRKLVHYVPYTAVRPAWK